MGSIIFESRQFHLSVRISPPERQTPRSIRSAGSEIKDCQFSLRRRGRITAQPQPDRISSAIQRVGVLSPVAGALPEEEPPEEDPPEEEPPEEDPPEEPPPEEPPEVILKLLDTSLVSPLLETVAVMV